MVGRSGIRSRKKQVLAFAAGGLAGLALGGAAHGSEVEAADAAIATAEADEASTLSGVEVEAQRQKQNNPKLTAAPLGNPQTVTVVSRGVIAAQNLLSLRDILSTVPGITFGAGEGGGGFGDSINLRGYTATNDVTVDNVRDSAQYSRSDPFNVEQIEVTNGSNSVYSGAGAVGGTINIVSKRPTGRNAAVVSAGIGSHGYYRATIDANQTLNDTVAVRLNAMVHRNDAPGRDVERFERWGVAPAITIGLSGPTQFTGMWFHQEDRNTPQYGVPYFNGGPVTGVDAGDYFGYRNVDKQRQQVDILTGIVDHDFGNGLKLRNLSRYQRVTQLIVVDPPQGVFCLPNGQKPVGFSQSTTATNITGFAPCVAGTDPAPGFYQPSGPRGNLRNTRNTLIYSQTDFTWDVEFAGLRHTMVFGASFLEEDFRLDTGRLFNQPNGTPVVLSPIRIADPNTTYSGPINYVRASLQDGNRRNQAVYAFDNIELNDQWSINGGLRWEHNEGVNSTDTYNITPGASFGAVTPGVSNRSDDNLLTWRVGVVYKPVPNASLYVAYGNSETPSQATVNGTGACVATPGPTASCTVDPETAELFELGGKWDVGGRLSLTAALFRNDRTNYRVASNDVTIPVAQLDGSARVDGVALGATGYITDQWAIFANYTYLKSRVIQGADDAFARRGLDFTKGDDLLQVPDHAFSLFTTYDIRAWKLQLGYGVTYQGETYLTQHVQIANSNPPARSTIPRVTSDDYMVHRLTVAWTPVEQLELRLNVNNVFDKAYYTRIRPNAAGGWATPGDTRNATLTASYRF